MTDETEIIDLFLQFFEGLDISAEQLDLFEYVFSEEGMPGGLPPKDEAGQNKPGSALRETE